MDLAAPQVVKTGMNSYDVIHGTDQGLFVEFEEVPIKNNFKSEQEGRPIFDSKDFIKITFPGDKTKQVFRPVKDEDKIRFKKQYESFKETGKVVESGTPLEQWAVLTKTEAAEFKAMKIHTVEALAALPDTALTWLGARDYRQKAQLWLENAKGGAVISKLQSENESLKASIEALKAQVKDIATIKSKEPKDGSKT